MLKKFSIVNTYLVQTKQMKETPQVKKDATDLRRLTRCLDFMHVTGKNCRQMI